MEISVLMPVYNAEKYVAEAIESTLKQSFQDFEFLIIDDGSTDNTPSIIRSYKDQRIRVIKNEHNLVQSLNLGLKKAKGKYIARMDADGIMHIDRLRMQYEIMEDDANITVCGSWIKIFGDNFYNRGDVLKKGFGLISFPQLLLLKDNFLFHPTVMMRSSFLRKNKIRYNENYMWAEDYKLWSDISLSGGRFFIEPEILLYHRVSDEQVRACKKEEQGILAMNIRNEILNHLVVQSDKKFQLSKLHTLLKTIKEVGIMSENEINTLFYTIFLKNNALLGF